MISCYTYDYQSIPTSLETEGNPSSLPFATTTVTYPSTPYPTSGVVGTPDPSITRAPLAMAMPQIYLDGCSQSVDLFHAIATTPPPSQITTRSDHPAPKRGIVSISVLYTYKARGDCHLGRSDTSYVDQQILCKFVFGWPGSRSLDASLLGLLEQGLRQRAELGYEYISDRCEPKSIRPSKPCSSRLAGTVFYQSDWDPVYCAICNGVRESDCPDIRWT